MSIRNLVLRMEEMLDSLREDAEPTKKLPAKFTPKTKHSPGVGQPGHVTPLANKVGASTTAPTKKVASKDLPQSPGKKLKPGEKMVFGRVVKTDK